MGASDLGKVYYIWLQGESDAINRTTETDYLNMLTSYKNDLKQDIPIDKFGIIEVGYFCSTVKWLSKRSPEDRKSSDEAIMQAQERAAKQDKDFVLLTQVCKTLSQDTKYITPGHEGHYNNTALAIIGDEVGKALSKL